MSLRDWLSALFSTFTAPEFASLLSAQIDGSAVASLAADTVQVGGIEKAAESLALDQRAVAQAYLAFVCGSEDQMHHNYLKVVQAFEAYITQDWHIHVFRMLCSDLVMLSFLVRTFDFVDVRGELRLFDRIQIQKQLSQMP
ncbi:hypothetical protein BDR26DRAFT_898826 [Obelidium mucronatum]|nr:hypothetical protein BDR26DRAFT_898826 [Obelidium mucronatum]